MTAQREPLVRLRGSVSELCASIGTFFYDLCARLDPGPQGEPCADCGVPVVVKEGEDCPECVARWEAKKRDEAMYGGAYEDGYQAAERARQSEGSW